MANPLVPTAYDVIFPIVALALLVGIVLGIVKLANRGSARSGERPTDPRDTV